MSKQPFMPLFFGDFLAATAEWSGEERALYLLLLSYQWSMGSLPTDTKRLAKLVDYERRVFEEHWPQVSKKFVERDERLYNLRLEMHRDRSIEIGNKRSNAGKTGAAKRWQTDSNSHAFANDKDDGKGIALAKDLLCHPSHPIPSQTKNSPENSPPARTSPPELAHTRTHAFDDAGLMDAFAVVRSLYPVKGGRSNWIVAERNWRQRLDDGATPEQLVAGVERYAAYVAAGGVSGPAYVLGPEKFFGDIDRPWAQPWTPPPRAAGKQTFEERMAPLYAASGETP